MDYITITGSFSINNLPIGEFTLEFSGAIDMTQSKPLITKADPVNFDGWYLWVENGFGHWFGLEIFDPGYNTGMEVRKDPRLLDSNVHHYEFDINVNAGSAKMFVDGVDVGATVTSYGALVGYSDSAYSLLVSKLASLFGTQRLYWMMISNIIRHTSDFAPPSLNVCPNGDSNTVLRFDLDEGGGTTIYDTSGYRNNGIISGATWARD